MRSVFMASLIVLLSVTVTVVSAYEIVRETAVTADGVALGLKRYRNPGGPPVVLMHGIVQNNHCWDLPYDGHSLAVYLADRGYDVWVANFRGHGPEPYHSELPAVGWRWTIDDLGIYDVPAIVDQVIQTTGQRPFWIGHSMGGMAAYIYLQGAEYQWVKVDELWAWVWHGWYWWWEWIADIYDWRVGVNDSLMRERNDDKLAGFVAVGAPAEMDWEIHLTLWNFWEYLNSEDYYRHNFELEMLAGVPGIEALIDALDEVPLAAILDFLTDDIRDIPLIGDLLAALLEWIAGNVGDSFAAAQVWYPENMTEDLAFAVLDTAVESESSQVVLQFVRDVQNLSSLELHDDDPEREPHEYSGHYQRMSLPFLAVAGSRDKLANYTVIRDTAYAMAASTDKTFELLENFGHVDMCVGINAPSHVYPLIELWIRDRCPSPTPSATLTPTVTRTPTLAATVTRTPTATRTATPQMTATRTATQSATATAAPTVTDTATPTQQPAATATLTPSPTNAPPPGTSPPSPTRTATLTPRATSTPINPDATAAATVTPAPLAVELRMPATFIAPGDTVWMALDVVNPRRINLTGLPLFVLLDIHGEVFFGPSWGQGIDMYSLPVDGARQFTIDIIPAFAWPEGISSGSATALAAITDPGITELLCPVSTWEFDW